MLNDLLSQTEHGRKLVSTMGRIQRQSEENARQSIYNCFGVSSAAELKKAVRVAQERAERFSGISTAAQSSGLKIARAFGEDARWNSPFGSIKRQLLEHCRRIEREEAEKERRESLQSIIRNHQKEMAAQFAKPRFEVEPVRSSKPIKLTMEINVFIIPKSQSTEDGGNPTAAN